jgi:hypothetical protein
MWWRHHIVQNERLLLSTTHLALPHFSSLPYQCLTFVKVQFSCQLHNCSAPNIFINTGNFNQPAEHIHGIELFLELYAAAHKATAQTQYIRYQTVYLL